MAQLAVDNAHLYTQVMDYSVPTRARAMLLDRVSYAQLRSGEIELMGRKVPTASMSSLFKARQIAAELKRRVENGTFLLTEPVAKLPANTVKHVLNG